MAMIAIVRKSDFKILHIYVGPKKRFPGDWDEEGPDPFQTPPCKHVTIPGVMNHLEVRAQSGGGDIINIVVDSSKASDQAAIALERGKRDTRITNLKDDLDNFPTLNTAQKDQLLEILLRTVLIMMSQANE